MACRLTSKDLRTYGRSEAATLNLKSRRESCSTAWAFGSRVRCGKASPRAVFWRGSKHERCHTDEIARTEIAAIGTMTTKYPKTDELLNAIQQWTRPLLEHPAFRQLARAKIGWAFDWEDDFSTRGDGPREVILPEPLATQHAAVMQFYNLWTAAERLRQTEFYFRRYPFSGGQVNRHEHLENICAMFFSNFYIFEERLRAYLNALNKTSSVSNIDIGKVLKLYRKRFKAELRQRHDVTHVEPFDDATIQAVMLRSLMDHGEGPTARIGAAYAYRKASREWVGIARSGSERIAQFLESVADASLAVATFLKTPPCPGEDELTLR